MWCFFMKHGHIAASIALPGLSVQEAIERSKLLFEGRRHAHAYDSFEVWEPRRMVYQQVPSIPKAKAKPDGPPAA
jgi:hypothetical protein